MPIISQFNYLKAIYKLEEQAKQASVSSLAKILGITPPSVTQQLRALSRKSLIEWEPRGAIKLTRKGAKSAVELMRKHRVIESFLVKVMAYNPLQAHHEAEEMEHSVSDRFIDGLLELCGHPKYDPHGDPIPDRQGKFPSKHNFLPLAQLVEGDSAEIAALSEESHKTLRTLTEKNLNIGSRIQRGAHSNLFLVNGKETRLSKDQIDSVYLLRRNKEKRTRL